MSEDSDPVEHWAEEFRQGINREENFRKIFHRFHYPVRQFFRKKGFSEEESGDLSQEVFLRVAQALNSFQGASRFEIWLYGLIRNIYANELRWRGADKRTGSEKSLDAPVYEDGPTLLDFMASSVEEPLSRVLETERRARLESALQSLPDQMRLCCWLRYGQGMKYREIATLMGISIETVKSHLFQARKRLAEMLRDQPRDSKGESQ